MPPMAVPEPLDRLPHPQVTDKRKDTADYQGVGPHALILPVCCSWDASAPRRLSQTETLPPPGATDWDAKIEAAMADKADKNVKLDEDVLALLKQRAESEGVSLDEAATEAVRIGLDEGRWRRLISLGRKYGKDSGYTEDDVESVIQSFRNENRGP